MSKHALDRTTKKIAPAACAAIGRRHFRITPNRVTPLGKKRFLVYRGNLLIAECETAGKALVWLEEYLATHR